MTIKNLIATIIIGLSAIAASFTIGTMTAGKPECNVKVYPNGTWEPIGWRIEDGYPNPNCDMPSYGVFFEDGSWGSL